MFPSTSLSRPTRRHITRLRGVAGIVALAALASCGTSEQTKDTVAVAPKIVINAGVNTTEGSLLSEIYGQALEAAGYRVARSGASGTRDAYYQSLISSSIDLVPDYTGELLAYVLAHNPQPSGTVPTQNARTVSQQIAALEVSLPPTLFVGNAAPAQHKDTIACRGDLPGAALLKTYTDLVTIAGTTRLGGPAAYLTDTTAGLPAFQHVYNSSGFKSFTALTKDTIAKALTDKTVDCVVVSSVDPIIAKQNLAILTDDKGMTPAQAVVPLLNADAASPDVLSVVNTVSSKLTTEVLNAMLNEIATNGTSPELVAKAFLQQTQQQSGV